MIIQILLTYLRPGGTFSNQWEQAKQCGGYNLPPLIEIGLTANIKPTYLPKLMAISLHYPRMFHQACTYQEGGRIQDT